MKRLISAALFLLALGLPAYAQQDTAPKVTPRLVAEDSMVAPGGHVAIALEEKIRPQWHTYWINPGDAGAPTTIQWTVPAGWKAGDIQWPTPKRLPVLTLMDYGYEGTLWLISDVAVPSDAKPGQTVTLKAAASWLVCKDICVPEEAALSIDVKVGKKSVADPAVAGDFAAARAKLPTASPWPLTYAKGANVDLYVAAPALAATHPQGVAFFPLTTGPIKNAAPQVAGYAKGGLVLRMSPGAKPVKDTLDGVLVLTAADGSQQAVTVKAVAGTVPAVNFPAPPPAAVAAPDAGAPAPADDSSGDLGLALACVFAFLGGLILNVMPCVLPILAMKALALAGHSGRERSDAMFESFSYAAGAIGSFVAFGLAVVALKNGGASVGWGFQLQQPLAVAAFALLIFAVGLNLSGLFEVGTVTAGDALASKGGNTGAFFTGVLAVAVAAPCTAPFMAAALGFALTQGALYALAVFFSLGVGFALPFLILGVWPRALSFLPRPGPWMLRLKQVLAFPMYGAAVWLAWVLATETGADSVPVLAGAAVMLAFAAWLWSVTRNARASGLGAAAALLALLIGLGALAFLPGNQPPPKAANAESFTPEKLASLRADNKPVFVDATAAWCITCLVNEKTVLSQDTVKQAFAAKGVTYMVADWTSQNADITKLLAANGRSGVPLYLYYAPGAAKPKILSQILTSGEVLGAIGS